MSFQILDKDNNAVAINELDKQAAEFWGKEVDKESYASPAKRKEGESTVQFLRREINWFDTIGYQIHSPNCTYTTGWDNVKASLWSIQSTGMYKDLFNEKQYEDEDGKSWTSLDIRLQVTKEFLKPFFDLIDHWASLGYIPKQIKD